MDTQPSLSWGSGDREAMPRARTFSLTSWGRRTSILSGRWIWAKAFPPTRSSTLSRPLSWASTPGTRSISPVTISSNPIGLSPDSVDLFRFPYLGRYLSFREPDSEEARVRLLRSVSFRCLAKVNVSLQPRPSGLRILQSGPVVLYPSEHVKEASSPLFVSVRERLIP